MRGRSLAVDHLTGLQAMVDEDMEALKKSPPKAGDVVAIERRTRAIGAMVKTITLVDGMRPKPPKSPANDNEDDMSEDAIDDGDDDMDPAEVERLRTELESRLNRLRGHIEAKRLAPWPQASRTEGSAQGDAGFS